MPREAIIGLGLAGFLFGGYLLNKALNAVLDKAMERWEWY